MQTFQEMGKQYSNHKRIFDENILRNLPNLSLFEFLVEQEIEKHFEFDEINNSQISKIHQEIIQVILNPSSIRIQWSDS